MQALNQSVGMKSSTLTEPSIKNSLTFHHISGSLGIGTVLLPLGHSL